MKFAFRQSAPPQSKEGPKSQRDLLLEDLEKTRYHLESVYNTFDNVTDQDLIDSAIYEWNSVLLRYRYLLNEAAKVTPLPENAFLVLDQKAPVAANRSQILI